MKKQLKTLSLAACSVLALATSACNCNDDKHDEECAAWADRTFFYAQDTLLDLPAGHKMAHREWILKLKRHRKCTKMYRDKNYATNHPGTYSIYHRDTVSYIVIEGLFDNYARREWYRISGTDLYDMQRDIVLKQYTDGDEPTLF